MIKRISPVIILTQLVLVVSGQDSNFLKQNAISIDSQDSLADNIYQAISNYRLIMVGELHGTKEAAEFVYSLAKLLTRKADSVQIGFEISPNWLKEYIASPTDSNLYLSEFFSRKSTDGRANNTWANILLNLTRNSSAEVFFYDGNAEEFKYFTQDIDGSTYLNRDSLLFLKVKKRILQHPNWTTITLSGNIHNMLIPYDNRKTMGYYLTNDTALAKNSIKILSIVHSYESGTVLSDWGDGLKIHPAGDSNSFFSKKTDYTNYLLVYPANRELKYNAIYFTRKITAAVLTGKK